jgi:drug/metabolite transporter (DMT)-like permease
MNKLSARRIIYFAGVGLIVWAGLVVFALLPAPIAVVALLGAALVVAVFGKVLYRGRSEPLSRAVNRPILLLYAAFLAVVLIGSIALTWSLARHADGLWLAWLLGALCCVAVFLGSFVRESRASA